MGQVSLFELICQLFHEHRLFIGHDIWDENRLLIDTREFNSLVQPVD